MGIVKTFTTSLSRFFRNFEYFSIHVLKMGPFSNTDKKICRECLIQGRRNHELCVDDQLVWLLELDYPREFYISLDALAGLSWLGLGQVAMWCNYVGGWWKTTRVIEGITSTIISRLPLSLQLSASPTSPTITPIQNLLITLTLYALLAISLLTSCILLFAITTPSILNPRAASRSQPPSTRLAIQSVANLKKVFWIYGFLTIFLLTGGVARLDTGDYCSVGIPTILGCWLLFAAMVLLVGRGRGEKDAGGGRDAEGIRKGTEGLREKVDGAGKVYD